MDWSTQREQHKKTVMITGFFIVFLLVSPAHLLASDPVQRPDTKSTEETVVNINDKVIVTGRIATGVLNGESTEYAYNTVSGAKLSELTWSFDNNMMVGAGLSVDLNRRVKLNGDVWFKITESSSMDDYDWRLENYEWTDWSHHDDVDLSSGSMFDLNAEINFYRPQNITFFGIVGFKRDNWAWDGRGGDYIYSVNTFRDTSGSFPSNQDIISYEQTFNVPYFGIGVASKTERFAFSARIIGSPFVDASAEDTHYLRNLKFEDDFSSGTMIGLDISAAYFFTPSLSLSAALHYQDYDELKGNSIVTDTSTGQRYLTGDDSTGLAHTSSLVSLGIQYIF